jgi:predicted kinase
MEGTVLLCTHETRRQRSHWIDIAREFPGTAVWAIVFDIPYEVSAIKKKKGTSRLTTTTLTRKCISGLRGAVEDE